MAGASAVARLQTEARQKKGKNCFIVRTSAVERINKTGMESSCGARNLGVIAAYRARLLRDALGSR